VAEPHGGVCGLPITIPRYADVCGRECMGPWRRKADRAARQRGAVRKSYRTYLELYEATRALL